MKLIRSVIRPSKLDEVKTALCTANVLGLTVTEVRDHGPDNQHKVAWFGSLYDRDDLCRFEVAIVVHDDDVDQVVSVIVSAARTKDHADGHVLVVPLDHRYNIHTGRRETC